MNYHVFQKKGIKVIFFPSNGAYAELSNIAYSFFRHCRKKTEITLSGKVIQGIFLDIAPDGGLLLGLPGNEIKAFYSGELENFIFQ